MEHKSLEDVLCIQKEMFNDEVNPPKKRYTRWPHRPALIYAEVRRLGFNGGRVLDIGCNTRLWLATLRGQWEKFGVELSNKAANIARQFTGADVLCGPIERYEAAPNSFDLIMAFAVIEHVLDPKTLVMWVYDHLKPGGLLILMTGDRESATALQMGADWPLYSSKEHMSFFSARSLAFLVESAGFQILRKEWRFMYTPFGPGSLVYRTLEKVKEILRQVTDSQHDHFYLYAQKPNIF